MHMKGASLHTSTYISHSRNRRYRAPFEHGLALIDEIPNSVLLTLEGAGHENHPDDWEDIIHAVTEHTAKIIDK